MRSIVPHIKSIPALSLAIVFLLSLTAMYLPNVTVHAQTASATVNPTLDTYVSSASPSTAYGSASTLWATSSNYRSFIRFDLSSVVPEGTQPTSVTFKPFVTNNSVNAPGLRAYTIDGNWNAGSTWNSTNAQRTACNGTALATGTTTLASNTRGSLTLPASAIPSNRIVNLCVVYTAAYSQFQFSSSESVNKPELTVTWETADEPPVTPPTSPTSGSSTFTPELDTYISRVDKNLSYETVPSLKATGTDYRAFACYKVRDIPTTSAVNEVKLRLYTSAFQSGTPAGVQIYANPSGCKASGGGALTWNNSAAQQAIFSGTQLAISGVPSLNTYSEITLPSSVITSDGSVNLGFKYSREGSGYQLASNESTTSPQLVVSWGAKPAPPVVEETAPSNLFTFTDPDLTDSSGWTLSRRSSDIRWTHEDRTHQAAHVFAIGPQGQKLATVTMTSSAMSHVDYEDAGSAILGGVPYIYVADSGGNLDRRNTIKVHRFEEPTVSTSANNTPMTVDADTWTFTYPSADLNANRTTGPDAEGLLVDPSTGRLYIVLKSGLGLSNTSSWGVYAAPESANNAPGQYALTKIASITSGITGAGFSSDGTRFVIRGSTNARIYNVTGGNVAAAFATSPTVLAMPSQLQPEGIAFSADGKALEVSTEKSSGPQGPVKRVPLPQNLRVAPSTFVQY